MLVARAPRGRQVQGASEEATKKAVHTHHARGGAAPKRKETTEALVQERRINEATHANLGNVAALP